MQFISYDFVPLALETYGGTSEKFDKLIEKLSSKAAEFNKILILFCLTIARNEFQLIFNLEM